MRRFVPALLGALLLVGCSTGSGAVDVNNGGEFSSTELAGDVAVLNFWGSWCGPCRIETPEFQEVYADVEDDGVRAGGAAGQQHGRDQADEQLPHATGTASWSVATAGSA